MRKMNLRKWMVGTTALALALCISSASFAAPKGGGKGGEKRAGKDPAAREIMQLEKILGAPLTQQQKDDISAAQKTFKESVAKAVGLTTEQLDAKRKEYAQAHRGAGKGGGAGKEGRKQKPA